MSIGRQKGSPKIGGRQKGSVNKTTQAIRELIGTVLTDQLEAAKWKQYLTHKDPRIAYACFELAVQYKHGKPSQAIKVTDDQDRVIFDLGMIAQETLAKTGAGSTLSPSGKRGSGGETIN